MSDRDEETFKAVQLDQDTAESTEPEPEVLQPSSGGADPGSATQTPEKPEKVAEPASTAAEPASAPAEPASTAAGPGQRWTNTVDHFKLKRFFVLRPGTLDHAIEDIKPLIKDDGTVEGVWLMAEIDHWNNEKERLVFLTEKSLLICKYDFIMLNCEQIQKVPLNLVDRITHGAFTFPPRSLLKREGEGVRVFWDKLREPSFASRWNPFAVDYPYTTFTYHPVHSVNDKMTKICEMNTFREQLVAAAQNAHARNPVPGKANGVLVLNQPITIEAYVGVMSALGNQNKLGYCLARGNIGF